MGNIYDIDMKSISVYNRYHHTVEFLGECIEEIFHAHVELPSRPLAVFMIREKVAWSGREEVDLVHFEQHSGNRTAACFWTTLEVDGDEQQLVMIVINQQRELLLRNGWIVRRREANCRSRPPLPDNRLSSHSMPSDNFLRFD